MNLAKRSSPVFGVGGAENEGGFMNRKHTTPAAPFVKKWLQDPEVRRYFEEEQAKSSRATLNKMRGIGPQAYAPKTQKPE